MANTVNCVSKNSADKIAILYAYHEKNTDCIRNLEFFLKFGFYKDSNVDYFFIVNGYHTFQFPCASNLKVIVRENRGFDFKAWDLGLKRLAQSYDYYVFLNTSIRGPFLPHFFSKYSSFLYRWYTPFLDLLKSNPDTKLVGPTINVVTPNSIWNPLQSRVCPVVQSYLFVMDNECLTFLRESGMFEPVYDNMYDVCIKQEVEMSIRVIAKGWNINCLVPEYQNRDYRTLTTIFNPAANITEGEIAFTREGTCFGRTIYPYEVLFVKANRGLHLPTVNALTEYLLLAHETTQQNIKQNETSAETQNATQKAQ
jgi:hypothetical protein